MNYLRFYFHFSHSRNFNYRKIAIYFEFPEKNVFTSHKTIKGKVPTLADGIEIIDFTD